MNASALPVTNNPVDTALKSQFKQLAKHYITDEQGLNKSLEIVDCESYSEFILAERNIELITGGVGREKSLIDEAIELGVPQQLIDVFHSCTQTFSGKMVYLKQGFGADPEPPTLYLELLTPWQNAFQFLESIPEVSTAIPALKNAIGASQLCISLGFSLTRKTNDLVVKAYCLCYENSTLKHQPLMCSFRLSKGILTPQPKYYRANNSSEHPISFNLNIKQQSALDEWQQISQKAYWSLYGYHVNGECAEQIKYYIFRHDARFNTWGARTDSIYTTEGNVLIGLHKFSEARKAYTHAIQYSSKDYNAYCNRAFCNAMTGKLNEARADAALARELEPNMNFQQAESYFKFIQELCDTTEQIAITPQPQSHNNLGVMLFIKGFYPQAKEHFQKATILDDSFAEAYNNLGGAFINLEEYDKAFQSCSKAIALNPETETTNYRIALDKLSVNAPF